MPTYVPATVYTSGTSTWSHNVDTTVSSGATTIIVKVTDSVGGYSTLTRNVIFDNGSPAVTITSPADTGQVAGTVLITGTASDAVSSVDTLSISITDGTSGTPTRSGNYWYYSWTTGALGPYTISVTATDMAGNSQITSIAVTVTANVPVVAVSSPLNGAFVKGTITATGTATATAGVSKVEVAVDNPAAPILASYTAPNWTSQDINTALLSEGTHVIYVTVTDNTLPSALVTTVQITVTVDNTPPTISINYPTAANVDLDALYGTVDVTGTASDTNLDTVEVSIDGGAYTAATGTSSWSQTWNTVTPILAKDDVAVAARATDKAGNVTPVNVTVDVRPHVSGLSKSSSFVGDTIAIYGYNFASGSGITFDGVLAATKTFLDSTTFSPSRFPPAPRRAT